MSLPNLASYFQYKDFTRTTYDNLQRKSFSENLFKEATKKCFDYLKDPNDFKNINICQKNLMIASSCVLLRKANCIYSSIGNHIGECKEEIELAQEALNLQFKDFPIKRMDKWLYNLSVDVFTFA